MAQALVRPEHLQADRFRVEGDEAHHLIRVLRKKPGDEVDLFDGRARRCRGVLTAVDPSVPSAQGKIIRELSAPTRHFRLRLFQGVPKGTRIDFVIEKAVELGADAIFPFLSERGQVKLDAAAARAKAERWNRVAQAAAKQCDRPDVPRVEIPAPLSALSAPLEEGTTLVFSLNAFTWSLKDGLRADEGSILRPNSDIINIVIGPESGLSPGEENSLVKNGARLVSMGERVLRTETAGLAALAILEHELNQR
jgi:16S rRNA (uracil1498-N3)-methyltransferase